MYAFKPIPEAKAGESEFWDSQSYIDYFNTLTLQKVPGMDVLKQSDFEILVT